MRHAGLTVRRRVGLQVAQVLVDEAVRAAERAGQLRRRHQTVAQAQRVGVDAAAAARVGLSGRAQRCKLDLAQVVVAQRLDDAVRPLHRNAVQAEFARYAGLSDQRRRRRQALNSVRHCAARGRGADSTTAATVTTGAHHLDGQLQVQRAVAGASRRLARRDMYERTSVCAPPVVIHRAASSAEGDRALVGALAGSVRPAEDELGAGDDRVHLLRRVSAPDRRILDDPHTERLCGLRQAQALCELRVSRSCCVVRRRQRLEVLAATLWPLVENDDTCAAPRCSDGRAQAGRTRTDHEHVDDFGPRFDRTGNGHRGQRIAGRTCRHVRSDYLAITHLFEAGPHALAAIEVTTQSKHAPMPQYRPRGCPLRWP